MYIYIHRCNRRPWRPQVVHKGRGIRGGSNNGNAYFQVKSPWGKWFNSDCTREKTGARWLLRIFMSLQTCTWRYICVCTCTYVIRCILISVCIRAYVCVFKMCIYVCVCIRIYSYVHIYVYVCLYVCIYIHIHIYIYTYIYTDVCVHV